MRGHIASIQAGFTLVELVVVLIIVGILSAAALPKFINVSTNARIAGVEQLSGALRSVANMVYSKCYIDPGCDLSRSSQSHVIDGVRYQLNYGWIDAGDNLTSQRIDKHVVYDGFAVEVVNAAKTRFYYANAPVPASCSVTYGDAYHSTPGNRNITIEVVTSGC